MEEVNAGVQIKPVTTVEVRGLSLERSGDGGDRIWEIGVNGEFNLTWTVRDADGGIIGLAKVLNRLIEALSPEIVEFDDGGIGPVKSPHPVVGNIPIGIELLHLRRVEEHCFCAGATEVRATDIHAQHLKRPHAAGVARGPACPGSKAQCSLDVAPVWHSLVVVAQIEGPRNAELFKIA